MVSKTDIREALTIEWPVIDVRSPGEFKKGHIPGAVNIPLFSDDERAAVGTTYKKRSPEEAKKLGYTFVTPKLEHFITESSKVAPDKKVVVHCWRGGQRSQAFAQHLSENGFSDVRVVEGGYKAFRNHVLNSLAKTANLKILGGYTGSGKTYILHELERLGKQVIDLEGLANHKGSAFGGIGQGAQPTTEQFENNLYSEWSKLDLTQPIWVEDESMKIGKNKIPLPLFNQMREAPLYFIDIPKEERAGHLVEEYAGCDDRSLAESIHKISERLGGLKERNAIEELDQENYYEVALITLHYYDKSYLRGMKQRDRENVVKIPLPTVDHHKNALELEKLLQA